MSDKTTKRGIYLYLDGKELKNDVKSVKNEMYKLQSQQSKMTIGSKEYIQHARKIRTLKGILSEHYQGLKSTSSGWERMSGGIKKYIGVAAAAGAALYGFFAKIKANSDAAKEFESRLSNLGAMTGLSGNKLNKLGKTAIETSTKITKGGVRIRQSAEDIVDAYTKMGSQRPELLKNADALAKVTEDAIILSEAAKSDLEPATKALANTMNQFNLASTESGRVINSLAAGSKEGAADIPYLSQAIEKAGTTAELMNVSLEETIGLIETAAPKFSDASTAGNSLDKVLLKMKENQIGYVDGTFNMNSALEELESRFAQGESAASIFGVEHAKMAEVLVQGRGEFNRYTKAVTGTQTAIEQAVKNTETFEVRLAQAKNEFKNNAIILGKSLNPAILAVVETGAKLTKTFTDWVSESPVEELEKEQIQLNMLAQELASTAEGSKERTAAIQEMNKQYPTFLEGLDAEKMSTEDIAVRLKVVNEEYKQRIALAREQAKVDKAEEKEGKKKSKALDAAYNYQQKLLEVTKGTAVHSQVLGQKYKDQVKIIEEYNKANNASIGHWYDANGNLKTLSNTLVVYESLIKQVKDAEAETADARKQLEEKMKMYKKEIEGVSEATEENTKVEEENTKVAETTAVKKVAAHEQIIASLEKRYAKEVNELKAARAAGEITEEEYALRVRLLDYGLLKSKQETLKLYGQDYTEMTSQILDEEIALRKELEEAQASYFKVKKEQEHEAFSDWESYLDDQIQTAKDHMEKVMEDEKAAAEVYQEWKDEQEDKKGESAEQRRDKELKAIQDFVKAGYMTEEDGQKESARIMREYAATKISEYAGYAAQIGNILAGFKDAELNTLEASYERQMEAAEGNAKAQEKIEERYQEKKKAIQKKYADTEFAISIAQIMANTALGIMQAFASLPTPAAIVAAALVAATGAVQLSAATAQRNQVKQLRSGKYNVVGEEDGRLYQNVPLTRSLSTGIVRSPVLVAEEPEMVIDARTLRNVMANAPEAVDAIMENRAVPQRASGRYPSVSSSDSNTSVDLSMLTTAIEKMNRTNEALSQNTAMLNYEISNGIGINYQKFSSQQSKIEASKNRSRIN